MCCLSWQIVDTSCWNLHWAAVAVSEAHGITDNEITNWWPAMTMPVSVQWISWQSHPCLSAPRIFARTLRSLGLCSGCLCSVCQKSSLQRRHFLQRRWAFINLGAGCLCSMPCVLWLMQICRTISHGYHQLSEAHLWQWSVRTSTHPNRHIPWTCQYVWQCQQVEWARDEWWKGHLSQIWSGCFIVRNCPLIV